MFAAVGTVISSIVLASWLWILAAPGGASDGQLYVRLLSGTVGTLSDLGFAFYMLGLLLLLAAIRRAPLFQDRFAERNAFLLGSITAVLGTVGSAVTLWNDFIAKYSGTAGSWVAAAIALQGIGALLLVVWCVSLGALLRRSGATNALTWGVVGATFLGLPWWFAWIGKLAGSGGPLEPEGDAGGSPGTASS